MSLKPELLSSRDPAYPQSLRIAYGFLAPPDIWFTGNADILNTIKSVGFCGSRKASRYGLDIAADCARQLGTSVVTVVSGYAPGVDMASHEAALASGGTTVVVLPEGIDHFRIKRVIAPVWDWQRAVVVSQFSRDAIWRADRAMERNQVIVALSELIIVLEARETGGTLNAGYSALKMRKPLYVALYDEMNEVREGNQLLLAAGGIPLKRNRATNHAQLRDVFSALGISEGEEHRRAG